MIERKTSLEYSYRSLITTPSQMDGQSGTLVSGSLFDMLKNSTWQVDAQNPDSFDLTLDETDDLPEAHDSNKNTVG